MNVRQRLGQRQFSLIFQKSFLVARAVPPHPDPLPWGEGESSPVGRRIGDRWTMKARARELPLPGERAGVRGKAMSDNPPATIERNLFAIVLAVNRRSNTNFTNP